MGSKQVNSYLGRKGGGREIGRYLDRPREKQRPVIESDVRKK